jgi:hypothetical protein
VRVYPERCGVAEFIGEEERRHLDVTGPVQDSDGFDTPDGILVRNSNGGCPTEGNMVGDFV